MRGRSHGERFQQEAELRVRLLVAQSHRAEDALLHVDVVDTNRAGAELPSVPDQVVVLTANVRGIRLVPRLASRDGGRERMVQERPVARLLVVAEERKVDHPMENVLRGIDQPELAGEVQA